MEPASRQPTTAPQSQALPSIASLTGGLHQPDYPPYQAHHQQDTRDSGSWSLPQSKRKFACFCYYITNLLSTGWHLLTLRAANSLTTDSSVVSNPTGLQLHKILNAEDSPSRHSVPETPQSARYASQHVGPTCHQYNVVTNECLACRPPLDQPRI